MRTLTACVALTLAGFAGTPVFAQDDDAGSVQVKLFGTAVLPDGKITDVRTDVPGVSPGLQTEANDNYVPTVAIEYFFTDTLSLETICCVTQHDVDGTTGLPGAELVSDAKLIPATFTLKYHLDTGAGIKPYIGAGAAYFIWFDEKPGSATIPLGVDDFNLTNEFGIALQAGFDLPINDSGMALSVDAKRYFIDTDATWSVAGTPVIQTTHKLDPWVISPGLAFRF